MDRKEYQSLYFQIKKDLDPEWYEMHKRRNSEWVKKNRDKEKHREYMRSYMKARRNRKISVDVKTDHQNSEPLNVTGVNDNET